jgi:hypothetical protein
MPISAIDSCSPEHWGEVLSILQDVIRAANFEPNLVSDSDDIGIIQKRIVQNIYSNELVICDVSGKNPNVMFELGMRLAFDKATIIVKDDFTDYSFDTSVIEHLEYPRDLRFTKIIAFKEKLKNKLIATYEKSKSDPEYSTFLKSFGQYRVAHLAQKEVSSETYILESLEELKKELRMIRRAPAKAGYTSVKTAIPDECVSIHISEYAGGNDLTRIADLKKNKSKILDYLKSIDHVVQQYGSGDELIALMTMALEDKLLLRKFPPDKYGLGYAVRNKDNGEPESNNAT